MNLPFALGLNWLGGALVVMLRFLSVSPHSIGCRSDGVYRAGTNDYVIRRHSHRDTLQIEQYASRVALAPTSTQLRRILPRRATLGASVGSDEPTLSATAGDGGYREGKAQRKKKKPLETKGFFGTTGGEGGILQASELSH